MILRHPNRIPGLFIEGVSGFLRIALYSNTGVIPIQFNRGLFRSMGLSIAVSRRVGIEKLIPDISRIPLCGAIF